MFQRPARGLLGLVVPAAQRSEIALARQATALEWRGVVEIALAGRTTAPGEGARLLPDPDQVLQPGRWPIRHGLPLMLTAIGLEPFQADSPQPGGDVGLRV
jgi:hypothetical protein